MVSNQPPKASSAKAIDVNGTKVAYWTYGDSRSAPLVMIHGFRGTHDGLELIARELADDFYIVSPDLPGYGDSEAFESSAHDLAGYTEFVVEFINKLNLQKPYILGHSFGSIVAAKLLAENSQAASKIALINPICAPALQGPRAGISKIALLYYRIGQKLPAKLARPWLSFKGMVWSMSKLTTKTKDREVIKYIDDQHFSHFNRFATPDGLSQTFEASISTSVRDFANQITVPTLLIVGDKDDVAPLEKQIELSNLLADSELKVIKNVGHLIHYEQPDRKSVV